MVLRLLSVLQLVGMGPFSDRLPNVRFSSFPRVLHSWGSVPLGVPEAAVSHRMGGKTILHDAVMAGSINNINRHCSQQRGGQCFRLRLDLAHD